MARPGTITLKRCGHHCNLVHPDPAETPNRPAEPREPATAAGLFCLRCGHEPHDERDDPRCPEYVAANWGPSGPDPEHCGCTDVDALYVRMREAEARAATPPTLADAVRRLLTHALPHLRGLNDPRLWSSVEQVSTLLAGPTAVTASDIAAASEEPSDG